MEHGCSASGMGSSPEEKAKESLKGSGCVLVLGLYRVTSALSPKWHEGGLISKTFILADRMAIG